MSQVILQSLWQRGAREKRKGAPPPCGALPHRKVYTLSPIGPRCRSARGNTLTLFAYLSHLTSPLRSLAQDTRNIRATPRHAALDAMRRAIRNQHRFQSFSVDAILHRYRSMILTSLPSAASTVPATAPDAHFPMHKPS